MRRVTASFPDPRALLCAALAAVACAGPEGGDAPDGGDDPLSCTVDTSRAAASALPLSGSTQGQICPAGDADWYSLEIEAPNDLLDLQVGYPSSVTGVTLAAQLYLADGTTPLPNGSLVDTVPTDGQSNLSTSVRIPAPGRYFLAVHDAKDNHTDAVNGYVVRATPTKDPDGHEPNDTVATAVAPDGQPGWFSSQGDLDSYAITVPAGSSLVQLRLTSGAGAKAKVHYSLQTAGGDVLGQGDVSPGATLDAQRAVPGAGTYYLVLSEEPGRAPDRAAGASYTLTVGTRAEPDPLEGATRNDTGATATCASDPAASVCATYSGSEVTYPTHTARIASTGDRDVYRVDVNVAGGAASILEVTAKAAGTTPMRLAVDLLGVDPASECTSDTQCAALKESCDEDDDCELSHACLPPGFYDFCAPGVACRLCAGAGVCLPSGARSGPRACGVPQYTKHDADGHALDASGFNKVSTAQPILANGPYYIVVHDFQDTTFDYDKSYTLDVKLAPEPDPNDALISRRNNFYYPYPLQSTDVSPNLPHAVDIDAQIAAHTAVTGSISYETDEDWYSFAHPCPNNDCSLVFEFVQPGPSRVQAAFLLREDDTSLHESWTYLGATPVAQLTGPVTDTFGDGDCHECSFAAKAYDGRYYLQVRDVGGNDWDFGAGGTYSFRLKAAPVNGCPAACSEYGGGQCGCYCASTQSCPAGPQL